MLYLITIKKAVKNYLKTRKQESIWLFPSRKGDKPITTVQAWRIINDAAQYAGIKENIGTHTMRKTFGYHALQKEVDIAYIMECLNHSSPYITKRYIGITQDELNEKVSLIRTYKKLRVVPPLFLLLKGGRGQFLIFQKGTVL